MKYKNVKIGKFLSRPNRFIANVEIEGKVEICHVRNTGRCTELLTSGAIVYVEPSDNLKRKTRYSLVTVQKGNRLINIDSQAPNKVFREALENSSIYLPGFSSLKSIASESTYGNSRFDFYLEGSNSKAYVEVKGVTLEQNGIVKFPDAPTLRGTKHLYELAKARQDGFLSYLIFVIQMKDVKYFTPNDKTDREFKRALSYARDNGVDILAYECNVTPNTISLNGKKCEVVI